ncbi:MAG: class I SAM-dependent methyltransferase [Actinomycetota bacterium]
MFDRLDELLAPPPMDASDGPSFWLDEHISGELLQVHLDPDEDLASRKPAFMDRSVRWIAQAAPPDRYPRLLDLGCGPGLYAERFAAAGYEVTGVDFSRRSIDHARDSARRHGLPITYLCDDYLSMELPGTHDFAAMIYCDYGVLSAADRQHLLRKVRAGLRPGGRFLLDVCSPKVFEAFEESRTWAAQDSGFWSAERHLCLEANLRYPDLTTLHRAVVITRDVVRSYNIWNHCFTRESLVAETAAAGFRALEVFSDVSGAPYREESPTIAVLLEK